MTVDMVKFPVSFSNTLSKVLFLYWKESAVSVLRFMPQAKYRTEDFVFVCTFLYLVNFKWKKVEAVVREELNGL